jgi:hypothetical protein
VRLARVHATEHLLDRFRDLLSRHWPPAPIVVPKAGEQRRTVWASCRRPLPLRAFPGDRQAASYDPISAVLHHAVRAPAAVDPASVSALIPPPSPCTAERKPRRSLEEITELQASDLPHSRAAAVLSRKSRNPATGYNI